MSLYVASLNSGSNGNCYYVGNNEEAILVDAGLSCKETEIRLKRLGVDIQNIKAIFISHEHADHIKGVALLSKKHQLPVYITDATRRHGKVKLDKHLSRSFSASNAVCIGSLNISAFKKVHDAADPYSFMITCRETKVGVFTDLGIVCENLVQHFKQCNAAFLESNYDEMMLETGRYPYYLKKRITGGAGHISNKQALELFLQYRSQSLSHLFLSHLSDNNNCPKLVQELFNAHADGVKMIVASRFQETELFHINPECTTNTNLALKKNIPASQLQLAFS